MYVIEYLASPENNYYGHSRRYDGLWEIPFPIVRSYNSDGPFIRSIVELTGRYEGIMSGRNVIITMLR